MDRPELRMSKVVRFASPTGSVSSESTDFGSVIRRYCTFPDRVADDIESQELSDSPDSAASSSEVVTPEDEVEGLRLDRLQIQPSPSSGNCNDSFQFPRNGQVSYSLESSSNEPQPGSYVFDPSLSRDAIRKLKGKGRELQLRDSDTEELEAIVSLLAITPRALCQQLNSPIVHVRELLRYSTAKEGFLQPGKSLAPLVSWFKSHRPVLIPTACMSIRECPFDDGCDCR